MAKSSEMILAVDAGVSTGWAKGLAIDGDITIVSYGQFICEDWVDTVDQLMALSDGGMSVDTLVVERFDLRPGNKFVADLTTVKVNSALRYALQGSVTWVEQTPAQAKTLVSNEVLKQLGWYPTGKDVGYKDANDARDALRHLAHYGAASLRLPKLLAAGW